MHCSIYIDVPSLVQQYSRHLCLIDWGFHLPWVYVHCSIYVTHWEFGFFSCFSGNVVSYDN